MIKSLLANRFIVAWIVAVAMFMETLDITIVTVTIPTMAVSFGVSPLSLKLALTSYLLSLAVFIPISGWVADKWGTKRVFISALVVFTLGSLACALSQSLGELVAARLLQGLGGAMLLPVGRIVVLKTFAKTELVRATNHMTMPALLGPALGPLLGGLIVHYVSWRWIFIINLPMGVIGIILANRLMINYQEKTPPPLDLTGFLLLAFGLTCFSLFLEFMSFGAIGPNVSMTCFVSSLLFFMLYVLWSAKQKHPILGIDLLRIKVYAKGISGSLLSRITISSVPFLMPLLFQVSFGWPALVSGLLVAFQAIGMLTGKSLVGHSLKFFGFKNSLLINSLVMALMVISLSFIKSYTPYWVIMAQLYVFGVTVAIQYTTVNLLCYSGIAPQDISKSTSLYSIVVVYSSNLGIAIAGLGVGYFAGVSAQSQHLPALALSHTFLVMTGFVLIAEALFLTLKATDGSGVS